MENTQLVQLFLISLTALLRGVSGVEPGCPELSGPKEDDMCCTMHVERKIIDRYDHRWKSCKDKGGCCGDDDDQYCCEIDTLRVYLGIGLAAGGLVILIIILLIIYCCLRRMGVVCRCTGCCKCEGKNDFEIEDSPINIEIRAQRQLELEEERKRIRENRMFTVRDTSDRHAQRYERSRTPEVPTAPPTARPTVAPPSFEDVVNNPKVFPKTDKSADTCV